jgi:hypothetical protein
MVSIKEEQEESNKEPIKEPIKEESIPIRPGGSPTPTARLRNYQGWLASFLTTICRYLAPTPKDRLVDKTLVIIYSILGEDTSEEFKSFKLIDKVMDAIYPGNIPTARVAFEAAAVPC